MKKIAGFIIFGLTYLSNPLSAFAHSGHTSHSETIQYSGHLTFIYLSIVLLISFIFVAYVSISKKRLKYSTPPLNFTPKFFRTLTTMVMFAFILTHTIPTCFLELNDNHNKTQVNHACCASVISNNTITVLTAPRALFTLTIVPKPDSVEQKYFSYFISNKSPPPLS